MFDRFHRYLFATFRAQLDRIEARQNEMQRGLLALMQVVQALNLEPVDPGKVHQLEDKLAASARDLRASIADNQP